MNLNEFNAAAAQVLAPELAAGFTGRISFEVDLRAGGIGKVSVRKEHDLRARTANSQPPVPAYREDSRRPGEWPGDFSAP